MTWFEILFVVIVPCALAGSTLTLFFLWVEAKGLAEYNLNGWDRTCYFQKEEAEKKAMWEKEFHTSEKRAAEAESRADAYLARLQKYGLEEQS